MARVKRESKPVSFYLISLFAAFFLVASPALKAMAALSSPAVAGILTLFCTAAFPVLMLLAGSDYLSGDTSLGRCYLSGLLRVFLLLMLASFALFLVRGGGFSAWRAFFGGFFSEPMSPLYSYIWLFIGFLIMQPFLAKMTHSLSALEGIVFVALGAVVLAVLPLTGFLGIRNYIALPLFAAAVYYPSSGKALQPYRSSGGSVVAAILGAIGVILSCVLVLRRGASAAGETSPAVLIFALSVFVLVPVLTDRIKWGAALNEIFRFLGGAAPGAVLVFVPAYAAAERFIPGMAGAASPGAYLLKIMAVYFVSLLAVGAVRLIPGAEKVI